MPNMEINISTRSNILPLKTAARVPMVIPEITAKINTLRPSLNVVSKLLKHL